MCWRTLNRKLYEMSVDLRRRHQTSVFEEVEVVPVRVEARRRAMICYEKAMKIQEERFVKRQVDRRLKADKGWREQARKAKERWWTGFQYRFR